MTAKKKSLVLTTVMGVICFLIWKFSGISLSHEIPTDYTILPHPTNNSIKEQFVYLVLTILLSICFYFPFYLTNKFSKIRPLFGTIFSIIFLFLLITYTSSNIKGVLLANWFGEDYGFGINLIKGFFISPIIYYLFNRFAFNDLPVRSLFYFFIMSFVVYFLSKLLSYPTIDSIETTVRYILIDGYFIFFYAIAFGLIGLDANQKNSMK